MESQPQNPEFRNNLENFHPCKFQFNQINISGMRFEEFQDGCYCGHLGYRSERILAILKLPLAPMPQTNFQFNWTYGMRRFRGGGGLGGPDPPPPPHTH